MEPAVKKGQITKPQTPFKIRAIMSLVSSLPSVNNADRALSTLTATVQRVNRNNLAGQTNCWVVGGHSQWL